MSRSLFSEIVSNLLDTSYRRMKRDQCRGLALPPLIYSVCFIQDWPFLRSLMDVWPADRLRILLNRESIIPTYLCLLRNLCIRNGVAFDEIDGADDAVAVLASRFSAGTFLVTASEGLLSLLHLYNSRITLEARRLGYVTVVLQHGMTMFRNLLFLSEHVAAWDAQSAANCRPYPRPERGFRPEHRIPEVRRRSAAPESPGAGDETGGVDAPVQEDGPARHQPSLERRRHGV